MFRLLGAIFIISATALWGLGGVIKLHTRATSLEAIAQSLEIMQNEICDRLTPMPELFELLSKNSIYPANILYRKMNDEMKNIGEVTFAEMWANTVRNTYELALNPQETLILSKLGYSIGKYDIDEQQAAIRNVYERIRKFSERAETELVRDSKVRAFTGVAAGIFTVIILI